MLTAKYRKFTSQKKSTDLVKYSAFGVVVFFLAERRNDVMRVTLWTSISETEFSEVVINVTTTVNKHFRIF